TFAIVGRNLGAFKYLSRFAVVGAPFRCCFGGFSLTAYPRGSGPPFYVCPQRIAFGTTISIFEGGRQGEPFLYCSAAVRCLPSTGQAIAGAITKHTRISRHLLSRC